jgi:hypothetical protein
MTVCTVPATATKTLAGFFDAYEIASLQVTDIVGDATDFTAYRADNSIALLAFDADDVECVDGYEWDKYCPLVLGFLAVKLGNYTEIAGTLSRNNAGEFQFKGTVTTEVSF